MDDQTNPPSPPPPTPLPPPPPVGRRAGGLSFGQFLGRTVTIAVIAPISLIVLPLAMLMVFGIILAAAASAPIEDPFFTAISVGGESGASDQILVVPVGGPILATGGGLGPFGGVVAGGEEIKQLLTDAGGDERIQAVVLEFNTPGGSITGSISITDGIKEVQEAGKPVVAYVSELSASGGMWSMAPADTIVASPGSLIGSIGVIFGPLRTYTDVVALDDGLLGGGVQTTGGIEEFYVTAGTGKDLGNPFRPLTDLERASLQEATDRFYRLFVTHVATSRDISETTVRDDLGALIFEASRAVELGLADQLGSRDDAWAEAAKAAGLSTFDVVQIVDSSPFASLLGFRLPWGNEPPPADLSGLCASTARAFVFHGDLTSFCGHAGP